MRVRLQMWSWLVAPLLLSVLAVADQAPPAGEAPEAGVNAQTTGGGNQAPLLPKSLFELLAEADIKYLPQDKDTALIIVGGKYGLVLVTVRLVPELGALIAYSEIAQVDAEKVPLRVWRKMAEINSGPWMAHVGFNNGVIYVVTGLTELSLLNAPLLKTMVAEVSAMADEVKPQIEDLLRAE